ncbi:KUP/HAK/KT family potassium transporter [uncultured Parolsenella sp.]|uniref:KUP/HAK/KT family potassium transporter n=1 Tax=uncultured Parolsenella sp. TaxID=2083008 RepID=UPI0025FFE1B9|nr:KUP/HAK/KT family potassium transporter [uncultured Parolsenella sp.]
MGVSRAAEPSTKKRSSAKSASIPLSAAMILVTLGVVYGDIGTSPMYTLKAIMSGNGGLTTMSQDVVIGALSLVIWTMTLITTVKYVLVAMKADNHNEGGIFALYSLVKRCAKWLIIPAMVGGAALLADGILTPAVTVTTAIEGLRTIPFFHGIIGDNQNVVVFITIAILCVLFAMQRAGTSMIGKAFGPIMTIWFLYLGIVGLVNVGADLNVFRALNPLRGITFLFDGNLNKAGLMVLGNVFLCTTGAEALYSDMGHVGKANIYASWPFVKACLILNYLGQGAWILANNTNAELAGLHELNPFFQMLPENLRVFAVVLSTFAAIIASQALITGSYSIISEAIRLNLMPHMRIAYPSETKGQIYIPLVNNIMWVSCIGVVLYFRSSSHMEAAYGLAITVTMLMTTMLLFTYLMRVRKRKVAAWPFLLFFMAIELAFFFSSLTKFLHGGYVTVVIAALIFVVMYIWRRGTAIERTQSVYLPTKQYIDQLAELRQDDEIPYLADNLVFLTNDSSPDRLDRDILYSILDKRPKRARAYFFLNIQVTDEPYTHEFSVNTFGTDFIFKVQIRLGFRVNQRVNEYLYQIVEKLVQDNMIAPQHHKYSIYKKKSSVGDFRFCLVRKVPSSSADISTFDRNIINAKYIIRRVCGSPAHWYGLQNSSVIFEYVPLFARTKRQHTLDYVELPDALRRAGLAYDENNDEYVALRTGRRVQLDDAEKYFNEEEDVDLFDAAVRKAHDDEARYVEDSIIGGDTAVFRPVSADDEEDESTEENED